MKPQFFYVALLCSQNTDDTAVSRFASSQEVLELAFSVLYDPDETLNFVAPNKYEVSPVAGERLNAAVRKVFNGADEPNERREHCRELRRLFSNSNC